MPYWSLFPNISEDAPGGGSGPASIGVRGVNGYTSSSTDTLTVTTPSETVSGDLLIVVQAIHTGAANWVPAADDKLAGWTLLDYTREFTAGIDHRHQIWWKYADGSDAGGGESYGFSARSGSNLDSKLTETQWGVIVAFQGVRDPGTDLEFLYDFEYPNPAIAGVGTSFNMSTFPNFNAYDGDGLLVSIVLAEGTTLGSITFPAEMDVAYANVASNNGCGVATEVVGTTTGDVGPKTISFAGSSDYTGCTFILRPVGGTDERTLPNYTNFPKLRHDADGRPAISVVTNTGNVAAINQEPHELTQEGDLLFWLIGRDGGAYNGLCCTQSPTPASQGWNTFRDSNIGNDQGVYIGWKWASADDASTMPDLYRANWTGDATEETNGFMLTFRGDTITPDTADEFVKILATNTWTGGTSATEPTYTVPYNDTLLLKFLVQGGGGDGRRHAYEARGAGQPIEHMPIAEAGSQGMACVILVEGIPVAGTYGGAITYQDVTREGSWSVMAISNGT
jgi:hypothetical protein